MEFLGDFGGGGWWWLVALTRRRRPYAVGGDAVEGDGAVGAVQGDPSPGVQLQGPAAFVDEVVVAFADRDEVVEIGGAEVFPERDVMDPAVLEPDRAVRQPTGPVDRS